MVPQDRRDLRLDRYNNNRPWRDFAGYSGSTIAQVVSTMFREPVHQILEKIKNEPYFQWPNKMGETPRSATKVFIASTTRNEGTLQRITELCGATWSN